MSSSWILVISVWNQIFCEEIEISNLSKRDFHLQRHHLSNGTLWHCHTCNTVSIPGCHLFSLGSSDIETVTQPIYIKERKKNNTFLVFLYTAVFLLDRRFPRLNCFTLVIFGALYTSSLLFGMNQGSVLKTVLDL